MSPVVQLTHRKSSYQILARPATDDINADKDVGHSDHVMPSGVPTAHATNGGGASDRSKLESEVRTVRTDDSVYNGWLSYMEYSGNGRTPGFRLDTFSSHLFF